MWMGSNVRGARQPRGQCHRSHVVEKDERADHAVPRSRQDTPDFQVTQRSATLLDDLLQHGVTLPLLRILSQDDQAGNQENGERRVGL